MGLLGYPLGHSFSKNFFEDKFRKLNLINYEFSLFEFKELEHFKSQFPTYRTLIGFSVTSPHKESIISMLDELDQEAHQIGAVNCVKVIWLDDKPSLKGFNTDYVGFLHSLKPFLEPKHERALILGTGGAAKAVAYGLKKIGINSWKVSRNIQFIEGDPNIFSYDEINEKVISSFKLIINTTPGEMLFGASAFPLIPYEFIGTEHLCYDLIYQPEETEFLRRSRLNGATVLNGLDMLYAQAEHAWLIWNR